MKKRKIILALGVTVVVAMTLAGLALWQYHERPQFCATCHVMQPYLDSWTGSTSETMLALEHAEEDVTCLDCHEPTVEQQMQELVSYVKADFSTPLKTRNFGQDTCFDCHLPNEQTSYDEIVARTEDYVVDGERVNPHATHLGEEECYRCHRVHRTSLGITYCYSCHHEHTLADDCTTAGCHGASE